MSYTTFLYDVSDNIATITLNRPERMNAFNQTMCDEFLQLWDEIRLDDDVHVIVMQAEGDRAFCTGVDVKEDIYYEPNLWSQRDPGVLLSPKMNKVWKPLIVALHGMVAGGAFYWINEADIAICSPDANFFDPHVTYGMTAALEPIGLRWRIPIGDVLRMALLGLDERMSADRALQIGLVTEVVERDSLRARARELAGKLASKPPIAIQGTVKAIWESMDQTRTPALQTALMYTQIGNPIGKAEVERVTFVKPEWTLR